MSREILSLKRREDGVFEIYADGELVEEYKANEDTWGALLPIKLWRHFNNIVEQRLRTMTKEEILAMEAGGEFDKLVATEILDIPRRLKDGSLYWDTLPTPKYSMDISAAWQIVEEMKKESWRWHGFSTPDFSGCEFVKQITASACPDNLVEAVSMPEAICKAALLTKYSKNTEEG